MNLILKKENSMKYSKYLFINILICSLLVTWSCDDRVPDSAGSTNSTLEITSMQAIADGGGESVGEVVSGYSSMRIVATMNWNCVVIYVSCAQGCHP